MDNHNDLGPWNRYEEINQNQFEKTSNLTIKQALLPRVTQTKPYIIKPRQPVQRSTHRSIRFKALQMHIDSDKKSQANRQSQNLKKQRNLSFEPSKLTFHNKNYQKSGKFLNSLIFHKKDENEKEENELNKLSKIDLLNHFNAQKTIEEKYLKTPKSKQAQFSKKRSIMEVLRYLKLNSNNQGAKELPSILSQKNRYDNFRSLMNHSIHQESRYIPYFQIRKSAFSKRNHIDSK